MVPALLVIALLLAAPAAAAEDLGPGVGDGAEGGVAARLATARTLVNDLRDQYALAAEPWDPGIRQPPPDALPRWTLPVADEAARALGALAWLHPEQADPHAMAQARAALAGVYDNLAWDDDATAQSLDDLGAALDRLAGALTWQQEAARPGDDHGSDRDPDTMP